MRNLELKTLKVYLEELDIDYVFKEQKAEKLAIEVILSFIKKNLI